MARVNVEQKALSDPRFRKLGREILGPQTDAVIAQALGLGLMISVWNHCQEQAVYAVPANELDAIIDRDGSGEILVRCALAEPSRRQTFRIRGTADRVEWLENKRRVGRENGNRGGRPRGTQTDPTKNQRGLRAETPPAPAPVPAKTERDTNAGARDEKPDFEAVARVIAKIAAAEFQYPPSDQIVIAWVTEYGEELIVETLADCEPEYTGKHYKYFEKILTGRKADPSKRPGERRRARDGNGTGGNERDTTSSNGGRRKPINYA